MSGHSKWSTIKRKKGETDAQRAKIFTKMSREITMAVQESGGDPGVNGKLRDLITKARVNNVPRDNIDRVIKKALGGDSKSNYESVIYEGYGPSGVAVIVESLTDNRNRTAGDVRHYFDKFGGNLGTSGCVSFMFQEKGVIIVSREGTDEDKLMEDAIEAGASDFSADEEDIAEITAEPSDLRSVREALEEAGYNILSAEVEQLPSTYAAISDAESAQKMIRLLEALEDSDDVQNVWHNWENEDEFI
ncbi:MAG: YebC/PmpR family DNA-binding transcriptional regulator [Oscillospiraceae bacterium]|jgi:YebC/PmpR family DNA-binding regulatory protein|nr:YebC/PmpR family DNA-binding transcriptional regulator [Oscillospiraceae bacterium]